ncbi:MAG: AAA family ATPase [Opitutales bacterium]
MPNSFSNPFRFNQVVAKDYFCRRSEAVMLKELILAGQNVSLIGPRRTGKTSLALEVCRKAKLVAIHFDLMRVDSYAEVIKRLMEATLRDSKVSTVTAFVKSLAHLRPTFTIDPVSGGTQWTVSPSSRSTPENVIDALRLVRKRCKESKGLLFLDEFQDLTALPKHEAFIAQMRSEMQRWGEVAVIFAGSDRDRMKSLFTDPKQPLYQAATIINVDTIERKVYQKYIKQRFERTGRRITPECIEQVFAITREHPNSAQKLLHFIWSKTPDGATADLEVLGSALNLTIRAEQDEFERVLDNLTLMQVRALKAVARNGGESVTGASFLEASGIRNPTSVTKALMRCVKLKMLAKEKDAYVFMNPFFCVWLKRQI